MHKMSRNQRGTSSGQSDNQLIFSDQTFDLKFWVLDYNDNNDDLFLSYYLTT